MRYLLKFLGSAYLMGGLFLLLAISMGIATFVENDFGTNAAIALFYRAWWFELSFLLLAINMIIRIFNHSLLKLNKIPILLFHISFLIIILGAVITRYYSNDGYIHLRIDETKNSFITNSNYIFVNISDENNNKISEKIVFLSPVSQNHYKTKLTCGNETFVFKSIKYRKNKVTLEIKNNKRTKKITLKNKGVKTKYKTLRFKGKKIELRYAPKEIKLPFDITLLNFEIDKYAGSESPSMFKSNILINKNSQSSNHEIKMNKILDYNHYRLYQSSYDKDEKGSTLRINNDYLGTQITYFGYFLMIISMLFSIIIPKSRFQQLRKKIIDLQKQKHIILFFIILTLISCSNKNEILTNDNKKCFIANNKQAKEFGSLWVLGIQDRIEPVNTLNNEILRKLTKYNYFKGYNADQIVLSIMCKPKQWSNVPIFTIKNKEIRKLIGKNNKTVSYNDFFTDKGKYKLSKLSKKAHKTNESKRSMFQTELLKLEEKINVFELVKTKQLLRVVPSTDGKWNNLHHNNLLLITIENYFDALTTNNIVQANILLQQIKQYQLKHSGKNIPSKLKNKFEIFYNKYNLFLWLTPLLWIIGLFILIYNFILIQKSKNIKKNIHNIIYYTIVIAFTGVSFMIILRQYISEHAPWSNGYESMVYVAWTILLATIVFGKRNTTTIGAGALFSGLVLMVAHLSWMNPQITNLVPVLQSYWLTFHVAIITAGYGFFALSAILALLNLILYIIITPNNKSTIDINIKINTNIVEMSLILGLYALIIGAFLGGIWANETWGRYWAWDPKETWTMVSILIYSFVVHSSFVPFLKSRFAFNVLSVISFYSIIMTYLGVNYLLKGLHSYAKGISTAIPYSIYISIFVVISIIIVAKLKLNRS